MNTNVTLMLSLSVGLLVFLDGPTFPLRACTVFCSLQMIFGISFSAFVVQSRVKGGKWPHDWAVGTKFHLKGYREEKTLLHQPTHMFVCLVSPPRRQQTGIQGSVLSFTSVSLLYLSGCPEPSICWNAVTCRSLSSLHLNQSEFCLWHKR